MRPAVHFNLLATLGVTYSITAVPVAVGAFLSLVNGLGGQPIYLYCFIFVAVFQFITCISVAELASGIPHSSGKKNSFLSRIPSMYPRLTANTLSL